MSIQEENLAAIAAAIREKEGSAGAIPAKDFARRITALKTGSDFAVPLTVTVDPGAQVTAVNGEHTVTGTSGTEGTVVLILPAPGSWTVTAALEGKQKSTEITVNPLYETKILLRQQTPDDYPQLDYIKFNSTSGIATGITPNLSRTQVILEVSAVSNPRNASKAYLLFSDSIRLSSGYRYFSGFVNTQIQFGWLIGEGNTAGESGIDISKGKTKIDVNCLKGSVSVGDNAFVLDQKDASTNPLYIGKNTANVYSAEFRLHACQIYTDGKKVRDFLPCQNSAGVTGLYDLVTTKFYKASVGNLDPGPAI